MTDAATPPQTSPYFRPSSAERAAYLADGFDLLETATEGKLLHWFGESDAKNLCDSIGAATIVAHDFVPTREQSEAFFKDPDAETPLASLTDGIARRQELFDLFNNVAGNWRNHGIGPIRTAYFLHALTITSFDSKDRMRFGGFPPALDQPVRHHLRRFRNRYYAPDETLAWLAYDAYLGSLLSALQVSWLDLEDALLASFVAALPVPYRKQLREQNVPDALVPIFWRHDLEHFHRVNRYGDKTVAAAKNLSALVTKIGYAEDFSPYLERLAQAAQPPAWAIRRGTPLSELAEHVKRNPPALKATYKALAKTLADRIEQGFGRDNYPTTAPDFVGRIYDAVGGGGGQKPAEFWQLCADIVYHLPILVSRLPQYTYSGDPAPPAPLTAEGFRSAVRDRTA